MTTPCPADLNTAPFVMLDGVVYQTLANQAQFYTIPESSDLFGFWFFAFSTVLGVYLVSKMAGAVINFIRR